MRLSRANKALQPIQSEADVKAYSVDMGRLTADYGMPELIEGLSELIAPNRDLILG